MTRRLPSPSLTAWALFAVGLALAGCAAESDPSSLRLGDDCVPAADGECLPPSATCIDGDPDCPIEPPPIVACGDGAGDTCADGFFCRYEVTTCGGAPDLGVCTRRPTACPDVHEPVCSCDGETYSNACDAAAAGASISYEGACVHGVSCAAADARAVGECDYELGWAFDGDRCVALNGCECEGDGCGTIYADRGTCETDHGHCPPRPEACTLRCDDGFYPDGRGCSPIPGGCEDDWTPVCGCDANTYSNACEAHAAGVEVAREGECEPPAACTLVCDTGFYSTGAACLPVPGGCTDDWTPVCGCDANTYSNACEAHAAGVEVAMDGVCGEGPTA